MEDTSRTHNSIRNLFFSFGGKAIDILMKFVIRTVFVYTLTKEYLGLSGFFSNILSFLSLAELGVGTAITFSMYKPIAENDEHQISILMNVYRKAYIGIGIAVLILGSLLTPFLPFFIDNMPDIPHIDLIYLLFVLNSGISYFYSYKSSLISAYQKNYIVTNNTYIFNVITGITQIFILYATHNYILYLVVQVIFTFLSNVVISHIADKMYPYIKKKVTDKLDTTTKNTILSNVSALVFQKLGTTIVFSTDNLLLTKMFGLIIVGLYSNYSLLISAIESIIYQCFNAISASVGNLNATAEVEHQKEVFYKIFFINYWIIAFSTIAFAVLLQPFVTLWLGDDFLMPVLCVIFIVLNFYIKGMRNSASIFDNSYGLMSYNKFVPIPECIINIVASIALGYLVGPAGIFIGTTVSTVFTSLWREPYVLFKYGFHSSQRKYWFKYFEYFLLTIVMYVVTAGTAHMIPLSSIFLTVIVRIILVVIIPNLMIAVLFHRTEEYQYFKGLVIGLIHKKKKSSLKEE